MVPFSHNEVLEAVSLGSSWNRAALMHEYSDSTPVRFTRPAVSDSLGSWENMGAQVEDEKEMGLWLMFLEGQFWVTAVTDLTDWPYKLIWQQIKKTDFWG